MKLKKKIKRIIKIQVNLQEVAWVKIYKFRNPLYQTIGIKKI